MSASSATCARRLQELLPVLEENRDGTHLAKAQQHYVKARGALDELAAGTPGKRLIHPQQVAKAISDHAADDAVFTCDVGLPTVWAARYLGDDWQAAAARVASGMARWQTRWRRRSARRLPCQAAR